MTEHETYSYHTYDLLMGDKHRILKSILRQLFIGIYVEIEKNCYFDQENRDLINDFINWPDDSKWDLNATAGMFNSWLFKNKTLDRVTSSELKGLSFSIGEIESKIQNPKYNIKLVEHRRLKKQLEVSKSFRFGFKKMSEIGAISREIIRMRNLAAHNNGLNNSSQALILLSNSLRLLEMIPDQIRESTLRFDDLENFIRHDFLNSILSLQRPDIDDEIEELNQKLKENSSKNIDTTQKNINEKLEYINIQLNELKDLKNISNNLVSNQISINEILDLVKSPNPNSLESISENVTEVKVSQNIPKVESEDLSRSEIYSKLMELRLVIKKNIGPKYKIFRKEHNLLDEPIVKAILNEKLVYAKDLKSNKTFKMVLSINKVNQNEPIAKNINGSSKKTYMDSQIDEFWPKIQPILEDYFKQK